VVSDATNGAIGLNHSISLVSPTAIVRVTTNVKSNYVDAIKATGFPIGDTITAQQCDSTVNPSTTLATNCDTATTLSGKAASSGAVAFPTGLTVKIGSGYAESGTGTCPPGGSCDIVLNDSTHSGATVVVPVTLAS